MGWWDYKNIGVSASRQNLKYVEKLFEYMSYCPDPDYAQDGDECSFREPDVYCCMSSVNPYFSDRISSEISTIFNENKNTARDRYHRCKALCHHRGNARSAQGHRIRGGRRMDGERMGEDGCRYRLPLQQREGTGSQCRNCEEMPHIGRIRRRFGGFRCMDQVYRVCQ